MLCIYEQGQEETTLESESSSLGYKEIKNFKDFLDILVSHNLCFKSMEGYLITSKIGVEEGFLNKKKKGPGLVSAIKKDMKKEDLQSSILTFNQPPFQPPNYQGNHNQQDAFQQPSYNQNAYQGHAYRQEALLQPTYQQPNYLQPTYQQPSYLQPFYLQPQSVYQQPIYPQAVYQQPAYNHQPAPSPINNAPLQTHLYPQGNQATVFMGGPRTGPGPVLDRSSDRGLLLAGPRSSKMPIY